MGAVREDVAPGPGPERGAEAGDACDRGSRAIRRAFRGAPHDSGCLVCGCVEELPSLVCPDCSADGWTAKAILDAIVKSLGQHMSAIDALRAKDKPAGRLYQSRGIR